MTNLNLIALIGVVAAAAAESHGSPATPARDFDPECNVSGPFASSDGTRVPGVLITESTSGSNGNCTGCFAGAAGTVIWNETGPSVIGLPNNQFVVWDVDKDDMFEFGGDAVYQIECGASGSFDFIGPSGSVVVYFDCTECE